MKEFAMFNMKKDFYERLGLPHTPFPVPIEEMENITTTGNIEFPQLLYWLQEYSALNPNEWLSIENTISRLAELIAPEDDRDTVPVEGDNWFLLLSPVNLEQEIVTIQRQDKLVAAIQPLADGRLKASIYRPLDAKSCEYLVHLGVNPHPEHGVNMRENNWEYALDNSATMGNMYASERGESYLSYWQYGIGLDSKKEPVSTWFDMKNLKPVAPNITATQIGVWYVGSAGNE